MKPSDLDLNRQIRRVLVRHWVDLGRMGIHSSDGRVSIRGSLGELPGVQTELTGATVKSIFLDIKRIPAVRSLAVNLDNWQEIDGAWQRTTADQTSAQPDQKKRAETGVTHIIQDNG